MSRVVLVHERFTERAGSEKVVEEFGRIWPDARVFAPVVDPSEIGPSLAEHRFDVSPLQRLYRNDGAYSHLLPLLPWAMGRADLSDADLVVVSHHAFGNRIRPPDGTPVVSYVHSPARWMWDRDLRNLELGNGPTKALLAAFARTQRGPDRRAAARIDRLVANSTTVADRIERWWGLEATVVPPPVDVDFYTVDSSVPREDFLLLAGRLVPYKRPQIAVKAATAAGIPLVVAGQGRSFDACREMAGPNVTFVGDPTDAGLRDLFRRCRALVFPGVEDFGIVPVEAQACGTPVIGVDVGGLRDTVIPGTTGVLVPHHGDPDDQVAELADAIRQLADFDPVAIRLQAERFGAERFRSAIGDLATGLFARR